MRGIQGEKASISSRLLLEQPGRPQIHKYKYTNTSTQTHKYTNTQIEIHKYTKRSFERGSGGEGINFLVASSGTTRPATNTHMFWLTSTQKCKRRNANYLKIKIPKNARSSNLQSLGFNKLRKENSFSQYLDTPGSVCLIL